MNAQLYTRSLGKVEYFYWLYDQVSCTNFVIICSLTSELDPVRLQNEIVKLAEQHPALYLLFVRSEKNLPVFSKRQWTDFKITMHSGSRDDIQRMVEEQLNARFGDQESPLFRVAYWHQGGDHLPTIIVTFHHALTDANAATLFVKDAVAATRGIPLDKLSFNEPSQPVEYLAPHKFSGFSGFVYLLQYMGERLFTQVHITPRQPPSVHPFKDKERINHVISFTLESDAYDKLLNRCKAESTTIQGVVCAAQLMAFREEFPDDNSVSVSIRTAVNLRPYLKSTVNNRDFGMYVSLVTTMHKLKKQTNLWELARDVKSQLSKRIEQGYTHFLWRVMPPKRIFCPNRKGALKSERFMRSIYKGSMVSNLGQLADTKEEPSQTGIETLGLVISSPRHEPLCSGVFVA
jgi:NRPS condensation-like uncharacterized protein